jgi:hypothetical protein
MPTILMIIGFGWALLGFGNLVGMFSQGVGTGIATLGLLVNMLLFVLPGLVVGGLGYHMMNRRKAAAEEKAAEQDRITIAVAAALQEERKKHAAPQS